MASTRASTRDNSRKHLRTLDTAAAQTVQYNDALRFDALTLLDRAKTRFGEIERSNPADGAALAVAVTEPFHLATKALLAARGFRALSVGASIDLLRSLYGKELADQHVQNYLDVQSLRLQGPKAQAALSSFMDAVSRLLMA